MGNEKGCGIKKLGVDWEIKKGFYYKTRCRTEKKNRFGMKQKKKEVESNPSDLVFNLKKLQLC